MLKELAGAVALLAVMLIPETLCNVLRVGERPAEMDKPSVAVVETVRLPAIQVEPTTAIEVVETALVTPPNVDNHSPLTEEEWAALCEVCAEKHIEPSLALGLIWVESRFDPDAVSPAGSYGYCQINPRWHPADLSPVENIRYGIEYLAECISRYDNLEAGLTAYNAGYDTGSRQYANAVLEAAEKGPWGKVTNGNH